MEKTNKQTNMLVFSWWIFSVKVNKNLTVRQRVYSSVQTEKQGEEAAPWERTCHDTMLSVMHFGHYKAHPGQSVKVATHYSHISVHRPSHRHDSQHFKTASPCPWRPTFHTNEELLFQCIYLQLSILAFRLQCESNVGLPLVCDGSLSISPWTIWVPD